MVIGLPGQVGQHAVLSAVRWDGENVTTHPQPTGGIIALGLIMTQMTVLGDYVGGLCG